MQRCSVCLGENIDTAWEASVDMCYGCADELGVMPMLPARRPARPCDRCNGMRFIRAVPRELTVNIGTSMQVASPMAVTFANERREGFFADSAHPLNPRKAYGYLEQYICRGCGFVEWYCNDPERVPIGPSHMTEEIDYASDPPYR